MNPFNYSKTKLNEIFGDVKVLYEDNVEEIIREYVVNGLKEFLEEAMKAEVMGYLKAKRYQHKNQRVDYRNGFRYRNLLTAFGLIRALKVPRTRKKGGYQPGVFEFYKRRWKEIDNWLRDIFIAGVSTRDVGWVMRALVKRVVSAATVSSVTKALDKQVAAFRRRLLKDDYVYLFLDGITQKIRSCGRVVKKFVLVAYGIKLDGRREVIDFRVAKSESERDWTVFLRSLYQRGLKGESLELVITDGAPGLLAALDMIYPDVERQGCWVHKLRNVANKLPKRYQPECLKDAKGIYLASSYQEAVKRFKAWCQKWRDKVPKAVHCLEKNIEELLLFYKQDKKLWSKLRTTNAIERLFRELRKRTRPITQFTDADSCTRITYALFNKYNQKWEDRRYVVFK